MQASVDHSRPQPEETLDFKLDSYPLVDWAVEQTPDLTLAVARGNLKVTFHSLSEGASVSSKWTVGLNDSALLIDSRFPPMERTLKETLIPLAPAIEVEGRLTGTNGKEVFEIQSAAGHELATVLAQRFATPLQNARATVQEEIHNRFMPQQKRLETRILNTTSRLDRRLADSLGAVVGRP